MRKILSVCVLSLLCVGCCGVASREAAYHDGVKQYALESGLLDEYDKYIDADPRWIAKDTDDSATKERKERTKKIRKQTPAGFRALIATEEEALKKD